MPCFITTRSAIKKITRKKDNKNNNNNQKQKFHGKNSYLNLKAPINKVKLQWDKTLAIQIYFLLTTQQMGLFLNETR